MFEVCLMLVALISGYALGWLHSRQVHKVRTARPQMWLEKSEEIKPKMDWPELDWSNIGHTDGYYNAPLYDGHYDTSEEK